MKQLAIFCLKPKRLFALTSLPCMIFLLSCVWSYVKMDSLHQLKKTLNRLEEKAHQTFEKRKFKDLFLTKHIQPNPYFLDQEIESSHFLKPEIEMFKSLQNHPANTDYVLLEKTLKSLENNQIHFTETAIRSNGKVQETEETQTKHILLNNRDLEELLSKIENCKIGSSSPYNHQPQLIIRDVHLKPMKLFQNREVFQVKMHLLKREFLKQKTET